MLERLAEVGNRLIATRSSNPRALEGLRARRPSPAALPERRRDRRSRDRLAAARDEPPVLVTGFLPPRRPGVLEEQGIK